MNATRRKRLDKLAVHIKALPLAPSAIDEALELFCRTGELPEYHRLAVAVVDRVLEAKPEQQPDTAPEDYATAMRGLAELLQSMSDPDYSPPPPPPVPVRNYLFDEAVYGTGLDRWAARTALVTLVANGEDPTDPGFLADCAMPEHGSVGMHLLGFPQRLAKPPYVGQGLRLFARFRRIRARIDYDDPDWLGPLQDATLAFRNTGELPGPGLVRDVVLADAEFCGLLRHWFGQDVSERLAAFDRVARARGDAREVAIAELQRLKRSPSAGW